MLHSRHQPDVVDVVHNVLKVKYFSEVLEAVADLPEW